MFKSRVATSVAPTASNPQDAMKQALLSVVQVWLDRLQHQAVVTTFFVSIDSLLFSLTSSTRANNLDIWSKRDQVVNASLGGAIIFHVCASILAYVASFVLIRYRLNDAEKLEEDVSSSPIPPHSRTSTSVRNTSTEKRRAHSSHVYRPSASSTLAPGSPIDTIADFSTEVFLDLRSLVSVYRTRPLVWLFCCGSRQNQDNHATRDLETARVDAVTTLQGIVAVLSRAHTVCAGMSLLGFVLALLGILIYSWTAVPTALGIFSSACLGACAIAGTMALWR